MQLLCRLMELCSVHFMGPKRMNNLIIISPSDSCAPAPMLISTMLERNRPPQHRATSRTFQMNFLNLKGKIHL